TQPRRSVALRRGALLPDAGDADECAEGGQQRHRGETGGGRGATGVGLLQIRRLGGAGPGPAPAPPAAPAPPRRTALVGLGGDQGGGAEVVVRAVEGSLGRIPFGIGRGGVATAGLDRDYVLVRGRGAGWGSARVARLRESGGRDEPERRDRGDGEGS